jgi:hypothetical protein
VVDSRLLISRVADVSPEPLRAPEGRWSGGMAGGGGDDVLGRVPSDQALCGGVLQVLDGTDRTEYNIECTFHCNKHEIVEGLAR